MFPELSDRAEYAIPRYGGVMVASGLGPMLGFAIDITGEREISGALLERQNLVMKDDPTIFEVRVCHVAGKRRHSAVDEHQKHFDTDRADTATRAEWTFHTGLFAIMTEERLEAVR
jgi:hypothetical protein